MDIDSIADVARNAKQPSTIQGTNDPTCLFRMAPDWLGHLAGFCTTAAFLPQVVQVWRSRSARDISLAMYALFVSGLLLWTVYGLLLGAWPIVVANALTLVLAGSVLVMKLRFRSPLAR